MVGVRSRTDFGLELLLRQWGMRLLWGSQGSRFLLDELAPFMGESPNLELLRAIAAISQADPIIKLLQEVRHGRKRADDPGLRAVTESWLATYRQVLQNSSGLDRGALLRLDPAPRLAILIEAGILQADHPGVTKLQATFEEKQHT